MTIQAALAQATQRLRSVSDSPRLDAEVLMSFLLKRSRTALLITATTQLTAPQHQQFRRLLTRRQQHVPVAYLTGQTEFFELSLHLTPAVLVPRPFTELLIETLLRRLLKYTRKTIVDVGTGSGAIALALASRLPRARLIGTDVSRPAVTVARENAKKLHLSRRMLWKHGSLLAPIIHRHQPDVVIANLPYLNTRQLQEPSIRHEPRLALDGGMSGLKFIQRFLRQATSLKTIKLIGLEFDPSQLSAIRAWLKQWSPTVRITTVSDGRRIRGLVAQR